jgi:UDP-N-acetylmuramate--alanine ligase
VFRNKAQRIHFVGIGGIGMSGIAELLQTLGYSVSGSDVADSATVARLRSRGVTVAIGHAAANVGNADVVVLSSAIKPDNPELLAARARAIPVIPRAEMLAELMRLKYGIAISGTHGKTTTTSLIATVLHAAGLDPTSVIGGRLRAWGTNAVLGQGEYLVAEADESDGSFLRLLPTIAVISNIDPEHLDFWTGGLPQIVDAFVEFANKTPFYGLVVACCDHPTVRQMLPRIDKRTVTYGLSPDADYRGSAIEWHPGAMAFDVQRRGTHWGRASVRLIGEHNVLNSLATFAVADELGIAFDTTCAALASFSGVGRRLEEKGVLAGIRVYDDYAHHPAEIRATLAAVHKSFSGRVVVAFQPHRYSRTQHLMADFASAFGDVDVLFVTAIYAASEPPIEGVTGAALADAVRRAGHPSVAYVDSVDQLPAEALRVLRPGDVFITMGAGNIWRAGEALVHALSADRAQAGETDHVVR